MPSFKEISDWWSQNNLRLNINTTGIIKFALTKDENINTIYIGNALTSINKMTFLGLVPDSNLYWNK